MSFGFGPFSSLPFGSWDTILIAILEQENVDIDISPATRSLLNKFRNNPSPNEVRVQLEELLSYNRDYDLSLEVNLNEKDNKFTIIPTISQTYSPVKYKNVFNTNFEYFV